GRRGVEIEITLLDVFAVIPFRTAQPEQPLFENRVAAVPERQREAQPTLAVGQAQKTVFAPAIRPAARVIVRKIVPGVAVGRVVFPYRAPLPLGKVRAPALPVR